MAELSEFEEVIVEDQSQEPFDQILEITNNTNQELFIVPLLYDISHLSNVAFFDENCTKIFCTVHFFNGSSKDYVVSEKSESGITQYLYVYITTNKIKVDVYDEKLKDTYVLNLKSEIELLKAKHNSGGVFAFDHWWPTVLTSIPQWNYLRDMARETKYDGGDMDAIMTDIDGNPFSWQTLDNGDIPVTANMVIGITNAGARNINKNSQNAKRHIVNLNASEHPEDYDFSDGWTEIYQN